MAPRLLRYLYTWARQFISFPAQTTTFWVNLQRARFLTRKPLNLRMGKGKGSCVGSVTAVRAGVLLLQVSRARQGRLRWLRRRLAVRCPFPIALTAGPNVLGLRGAMTPLPALRSKHLQGRYIWARWDRLDAHLRPRHQLSTLRYLTRIFWRQMYVPRAGYLTSPIERWAWRRRRRIFRRRRLGRLAAPAGATLVRHVFLTWRHRRKWAARLQRRAWRRVLAGWAREAGSRGLFEVPGFPWDRLFRLSFRAVLMPAAAAAALLSLNMPETAWANLRGAAQLAYWHSPACQTARIQAATTAWLLHLWQARVQRRLRLRWATRRLAGEARLRFIRRRDWR